MKKTFTLLLLWIGLMSVLPSCEREKVEAIDFTFQATIQKSPVTKGFYYVNQPYQGKIALDIDPRNESKIETTFLTEGEGFALIGDDKQKVLPGETFIHNYRENALPIEVYLTSIGKNVIKFDFSSEHYNASITDSILVKDLHYTISVDSLPEKMLIGKKFSFRLNIEEKEKTDNEETTASGAITKGAGIMYVKDQVFINKSNDIVVTDPKDLIEGQTKASTNNNVTLSIGRNILTYLPQEDELNEINLKINNPYNSSQTYSMSFNIEKPIFKTEAIVDEKAIPYVRKDYSFLLKVSQVDVYENNDYSLTYRFLKSTANLKVNATDIHPGENLKIKEGENIVILNSEIKENCDIEFIVSDKFGSQYKDTANINFQALPVYNVVIPETEGGIIVGAGSYEESSSATLTATAATGYTFSGFFDSDNTLLSSNPEYSFTVLEDKTIKAIFKKNIYKIDAIAGEGGKVTGSGSYEFASNITLRATPDNGYCFVGWFEGDNLVSPDVAYSFQASTHRSLIGRFKLNKLTLSIAPSTIECSTGEAAQFNLKVEEDGYEGTFQVYYKAITGEGIFSGKEMQVLAKGSHAMRYTPEIAGTHTLNFRAVDSNGQEQTTNITITAAATELKASSNINETAVTQNEAAEFNITIEEDNHPKKFSLTYGLSEGTGKLLVDGTELGNTSSASLAAGSHKLKYTPTNVGTSKLKFTIADARGQKKEVNVDVISKAKIIATAGANGSVTGSGSYTLNETVKLEAIPETGYGFTGWFENSANVSNDIVFSFPATTSRNLQARFGTNKYTITVIAGEGGSVTGSGSYEFGSQQTITATPKDGYSFDSWSDQKTENTLKLRAVSTDNAIKRIITIGAENKTYIAAFKKNQYTISVAAGTGGTVTGGGSFDFGAETKITATPKAGYKFVKWSDGNSNATRTIKVDARDATYTAEFTTNKYEVKVIAGEGGTVSGAGFYNYGTEQVISATPKTGYRFVKWGDGDTNASRQIRIEAKDATYTAEFAANKYEVKVVAGEGGTVSGAGFYDFGTEQVITATPKTGYSFSKWGDDKIETASYRSAKTAAFLALSNVNEPVKRTILIKAATVTYTAEFTANKYLINVTAGDGGSVTGTGNYPFGSQQTITATAKTGYHFVKWSDGDTNASRKITVGAEDKTYTATFAINQYEVIAVTESNHGTVTGGKSYNYNDVANLRATAEPGYAFAGWYEAGKKVSDDNPYSFPVLKERSFTAKFEITKHFVTVTSGGNGTVTGSGLYEHGSQQTITAKANTGYSFSKWNDDNDGNTDATRVILVDKEITYVALFTPNKYAVTVNAGTGGTVTGSGSYPYGTLQTITATASEGYSFSKWDDGDKNAIRNITIGSNPITYTAVFTPNKYIITITAGTGGTASGGGSFDFATQQTITATPSTGYHFVKWNDGNTEANRKITITAENKTYSAEFAPNKYTITVNAGTGGTVTGSGAYNYGTEQTITATASTGYSFSKWNDGNTDATRKIRIEAKDQTYTASFTPNKYVITVTSGGNGSVTGSGSYDFGTEQTITATPATGYHFVKWSDGNTDATRKIRIEAKDQAYTATFAINQYVINATAGTGGTVKGGGTFNHGTTVTLTATPNNGYSFVNWSEGSSNVSTTASYIFEATKARTLLASFKKNEISASVDKPSQDVKVGQEAPIQLSISEDNYEGTFTVKYELVSGSGTFSGGATQTVAAGKHAMNFVPSTAGTHTYRLTIIDAFGTNKVVNVTVTSTLSPIVLQPNMTSFNLGLNGEAEIQFNVSEVAYNDKFTLRYDLTGASGTFKVNNVELQSGLTTQINSGKTTLKFQINQIGDANLKLSVSDTRGQTETVTIKVNAASTITVSAGTGGTASGGGTFNTLNAVAHLTATASTGYSFAGWYEGGTKVSSDANYSFTVTSSRALEARFNVNSYRLNVVANPAEGGSVSGSGTFPYGSQQTITASPNTAKYYIFEGWNDGNMSTSRTVTIGNSDVTYTAKFKAMPPVEQPVYLKTYGTGSGTVYINGSVLYDGAKFAPGTYTLTATPASNCSSSWTTQTITITDKPVNVEVTFTLEVYYTVSAQANGYGSVKGGGTYKAGTSCTVTATAVDGSKFVSWGADGETLSTSNQYTFTVTKDIRLIAKFKTTGGTRPGTRE